MNRTINTHQIEKKEVKEYESWMEQQKEYEQLLKKATLEIHEKPAFPTDKYYTAYLLYCDLDLVVTFYSFILFL